MTKTKVISIVVITAMIISMFAALGTMQINAKKAKKATPFSVKKDITVIKIIHYKKAKKLYIKYKIKKVIPKNQYCSFWTGMADFPYWLFDTGKKKKTYTKTLKLNKNQNKDIGTMIVAHDHTGTTKWFNVKKN